MIHRGDAMCLEYVTRNRFKKGEHGTGYIVVDIHYHNKDAFTTPVYDAKVELGEWYVDYNRQRVRTEEYFRHLGTNQSTYRVGYHILHHYQDAKRLVRDWGFVDNYAILEVDWTHPVAEGVQEHYRAKLRVIVVKARRAKRVMYRVYRGKVIDNIYTPGEQD